MNADQYLAIQTTLMGMAHRVQSLDLDGFIDAINLCETVGPITDPTAMIYGSKRLAIIKKMAVGLREFKRSIPSIDVAREADELAWLYPGTIHDHCKHGNAEGRGAQESGNPIGDGNDV